VACAKSVARICVTYPVCMICDTMAFTRFEGMAKPTPLAGVLNSGSIAVSVALNQLLEACQTIEARAAELAASLASELEVSDLEELVQRVEQCVHLPARYLTAIVDFHLAITEMAHNAVFTLALQAMRNTLIQELNRLISDQQLRSIIILELKDIWKAISDRDSHHAGQLMRSHLRHLDQRSARASLTSE
jgi:GntR family transcriptional regulator, transcriptional repressor for pyruvate dehydrogenase complex